MSGDFHALRMYADKKMKFKQGKLLAALGAGPLGDHPQEENQVMRWASAGVCASLCANWLNHNAGLHGNRQDAIVAGVNGQFMYKYGFDSDAAAYLEHVGLVGASISLPKGGKDTLEDGMRIWMRDDTARNPISAFITFTVFNRATNKVAGNHAVAAVKKRGSRMDFFEPNAGWYQIVEGKEQDFCRELTNCYSGLEYDLQSVKFYPVKHKSLRRKTIDLFK